MQIESLKVFCDLAETESFTKAAQINQITQSAVSQQVSALERTFKSLLIERLRKISPEMKIICASGFIRPPSNEEDENYLQKPFASQDLLRKVKQVLGADSGKH